MKLKKEDRISDFQKGKFRRRSSGSPERALVSCESYTPFHTLNEERGARFTAQHLSALKYSIKTRACETDFFSL